MNYFPKARREAFELVKETCPIVKDKLETLFYNYDNVPRNFINDIMEIVSKFGTDPLRNALIDQIESRMTAEAAIEELECQAKQFN